MNYGFVIDNRRCIGCHACTIACKAEHNTPLGVNRTWVKYVEKGTYPETRRLFTVHRCNHCEEPPCVDICPVTSLHKRPDGIVDFDSERCIGCKACMQACPYDALHIDPETHTSSKCNYCAHRVSRGVEPACVVVCPAEAIISGDLDDPQSRISRLVGRHQVSVRKPEKHTKPKLYYIAAEAAAIRPEMAPADMTYTTVEQAGGVGHYAGKSMVSTGGTLTNSNAIPFSVEKFFRAEGGEPPAVGKARRTHDAPQRGVLWGWEVSGYLWTKSIAAGLVFLPMLLHLIGVLELRPRMGVLFALMTLVFLGLTGALLVKDLDKPMRFHYVLLRPQWKSWLVRGAYIITVFGGLTTLWLLLVALGVSPASQAAKALAVLLVPLGVMTAVYTAFLFGQAKGRDLWQNPLLPVRMLVISTMTGAAAALLLALLGDQGVPTALHTALVIAVIAHLGLAAAELFTPHVTVDTATAMGMITRGPLALSFWSSLALGNVLPLAMLLISDNGLMVLPAAVLVLVFAAVSEHVWVRAPQLIPLS